MSFIYVYHDVQSDRTTARLHVSCYMYQAACLMLHVSGYMYQAACIMLHVSGYMYQAYVSMTLSMAQLES